MSGLSHTPGKRARGKTLRGFESRLLRQMCSCELPRTPSSFRHWGFFIGEAGQRWRLARVLQ